MNKPIKRKYLNTIFFYFHKAIYMYLKRFATVESNKKYA